MDERESIQHKVNTWSDATTYYGGTRRSNHKRGLNVTRPNENVQSVPKDYNTTPCNIPCRKEDSA